MATTATSATAEVAVAATATAAATKPPEILPAPPTCGASCQNAKDSWEQQYSKVVAECEERTLECARLASALEKQEVTHCALIQTLSKDVATATEQAQASQKAVERASATSQKDALLQRLFQDQLDAKKTEIAHLQAKLERAVAERAAAAAELKTTTTDLEDLRRAVGERSKEYERRIQGLEQTNKDLTAAIADGKAQRKETDLIMDKLKGQYCDHVTEAGRREQMQRRTEAQLKGDVHAIQEQLLSAQREAARAAVEAAAEAAGLRGELAALRAATDAEKAELRDADTERAKEMVTLRSEHERLRLQFSQVSGQVLVSHSDATQKITALHESVGRLENEIQTAQEAYKQLQQVSERTEAALQAKLNVAEEQIARLEADSVERDKANKDAALLTFHERQRYKTQAQEKAQELEALQAVYQEFKLNVGTEMAVLRRREHDALHRHHAAYAVCESKWKQTEAELTLVSGRLGSAVDERATAAEALERLQEEQERERTARKAEVEGYEATVKKLEEEVLCTYDKRVLAQQNEELKEASQVYRNQISTLHHTVATVRLEADIIESHKTKSLQESNAECVRHIIELQDQLEANHALLAELLPNIDADALPASVSRLLAAFHRKHQNTNLGKLLSSYQALSLPIDGTVSAHPSAVGTAA